MDTGTIFRWNLGELKIGLTLDFLKKLELFFSEIKKSEREKNYNVK